ncbi:MAG TPA: hypothetical protein VGD91_32145 [Trebonia sp.]
MDLTPGQLRLVFAVVVLALVALGVYLIGHRGSGGTSAAPTVSASRSIAAPAPSASSASSSPGIPPSAVPAPAPVSTKGGAEIYQWLPFNANDLAAAASTTVTFAKAYSTWSYTEDKAAYGASLSSLVTPKFVAVLEYDYNTAGVAGPRGADQQVSTGSGTIDSISSFGGAPAPSITFLVTISQQVKSTQPTARLSGQWAVTVVPSGGSWQVSNLQLSSLGNH